MNRQNNNVSLLKQKNVIRKGERRVKTIIYKGTETDEQALLTAKLADASSSYYNTGIAVMSDIEFDRELERLRGMEEKSGFAYDISPTVYVGARVVDGLQKDRHEFPALSLDKVKYANREDLRKWLGDRNAVVSWKMDGLTVVLTYDDGKLTKAVTRGNGEEGSVITHNAVFFEGIPHRIPFDGPLVVRGEAVMPFTEFERVNAENGGIYENARNLASATIQMLDSNESRKRKIRFYAFRLVTPEASPEYLIENPELEAPVPGGGIMTFNGQMEYDRLEWLHAMGFLTVGMDFEHDGEYINAGNILAEIEAFREKLPSLDYPTDGLVISFADTMYADSLGSTGHHCRGSIALKWTDETVTTTVRSIDWSVGKTGAITPVAVFDTVRLGLGSNVSRASLHNLSIMNSLPSADGTGKKGKLKIGSRVQVYLANMIIPQIAGMEPDTDDCMEICVPDKCPVCGGDTKVVSNNGVDVLMCVNPECQAKHLKKLATFVSRDGADIEGLSESRIEYLTGAGLVRCAADFYTLKDRPDAVKSLKQADGWGEKSVEKLLSAIERSRTISFRNFLYSLSIPLLGHDLSGKLDVFFGGDINAFTAFVKNPDGEKLSEMDGIGPVKAKCFCDWCRDTMEDAQKKKDFTELVGSLKFSAPEEKQEQSLAGKTFVITGSVHEYANRDEFKASVEARGGKVSGSVSAKTTCLVNNDVTSTSGKNRKAKELGIPIISEDEFIATYGK